METNILDCKLNVPITCKHTVQTAGLRGIRYLVFPLGSSLHIDDQLHQNIVLGRISFLASFP